MGKTIVEQECAHVVNTWHKATAVGDTTKAYSESYLSIESGHYPKKMSFERVEKDIMEVF